MAELVPVTADLPATIDAAMIDAARRAMSANSWRALRADFGVSRQWAVANAVGVLPATPQAVAAFLRSQAEHGKKAATLARYASSIGRQRHRFRRGFDPRLRAGGDKAFGSSSDSRKSFDPRLRAGGDMAV